MESSLYLQGLKRISKHITVAIMGITGERCKHSVRLMDCWLTSVVPTLEHAMIKVPSSCHNFVAMLLTLLTSLIGV
jgi:hypothetical protein